MSPIAQLPPALDDTEFIVLHGDALTCTRCWEADAETGGDLCRDCLEDVISELFEPLLDDGFFDE